MLKPFLFSFLSLQLIVPPQPNSGQRKREINSNIKEISTIVLPLLNVEVVSSSMLAADSSRWLLVEGAGLLAGAVEDDGVGGGGVVEEVVSLELEEVVL